MLTTLKKLWRWLRYVRRPRLALTNWGYHRLETNKGVLVANTLANMTTGDGWMLHRCDPAEPLRKWYQTNDN